MSVLYSIDISIDESDNKDQSINQSKLALIILNNSHTDTNVPLKVICPCAFAQVKRFADSYTGTIASGLAERLETLTGRKPHLVKLLLKRNKLDANRLLPEATFGNPDAIAVYNEYYSAVDEVRHLGLC